MQINNSKFLSQYNPYYSCFGALIYCSKGKYKPYETRMVFIFVFILKTQIYTKFCLETIFEVYYSNVHNVHNDIGYVIRNKSYYGHLPFVTSDKKYILHLADSIVLATSDKTSLHDNIHWETTKELQATNLTQHLIRMLWQHQTNLRNIRYDAQTGKKKRHQKLWMRK